MKTIHFFSKAVMATIFCLAIFAGSKAKAQIANPYVIQNNTGCNIDIDWFADNSSGTCDSNPTTLSLSPGSNSISWSTGSCGSALHDFKITVTDIGGCSVTVYCSVVVGTATIPPTTCCGGNHIINMGQSGGSIN